MIDAHCRNRQESSFTPIQGIESDTKLIIATHDKTQLNRNYIIRMRIYDHTRIALRTFLLHTFIVDTHNYLCTNFETVFNIIYFNKPSAAYAICLSASGYVSQNEKSTCRPELQSTGSKLLSNCCYFIFWTPVVIADGFVINVIRL